MSTQERLKHHGRALQYRVSEAHLKVGQSVEFLYPSESTGEPIPQIGGITKITEHSITIQLRPGISLTFKKNKIVDGVVNIWTH